MPMPTRGCTSHKSLGHQASIVRNVLPNSRQAPRVFLAFKLSRMSRCLRAGQNNQQVAVVRQEWSVRKVFGSVAFLVRRPDSSCCDTQCRNACRTDNRHDNLAGFILLFRSESLDITLERFAGSQDKGGHSADSGGHQGCKIPYLALRQRQRVHPVHSLLRPAGRDCGDLFFKS